MSIAPALTDALLVAIHAANLRRDEANAAEPYVHAAYAAVEARIDRLVAVLADGDEELADAFGQALFDITHDGLAHLRRVFADIVREQAAQRELDAIAAAHDAFSELGAEVTSWL